MRDVSKMSIEELLSVVFRTSSCSGMVKELTAKYITAKGMHLASLEELRDIKGIGGQRALLLKAVLELGYRITSAPKTKPTVIQTPEDVFRLFHPKLCLLDREHFFAVHLNTKNIVISTETVSIGSLNQTIVHPREIFKNAIKRNSAAIILAHNHPSGDPTPSEEDVAVTKRLVEAGSIVGIDILDHIIIAADKYHSFKSEGLI